jgi:hypothetical protein
MTEPLPPIKSAMAPGDHREPCCRNEANMGPAVPMGPGGCIYRRCKVCDRRHFEMTLDPGRLGLRLS